MLELPSSLPRLFSGMRPFLSFLFWLSFFSSPILVDAQCTMRVMDTRELVLNADLIARVRVRATKNIRNPMYGQLATLEIREVIYGDPRHQEVRVWAMSTTYCARDVYVPQQEMLVFLERDQTLFHTVNWQYGQFLINGETVEDWRGRSPGTTSGEAAAEAGSQRKDAPRGQPRPFAEVKQEILTLLEEARRNGKGRP
jgi:hypothetical protein